MCVCVFLWGWGSVLLTDVGVGAWCVPLCTVSLVNRGTCCEVHLLSGTGGTEEGASDLDLHPPPGALPLCLTTCLSVLTVSFSHSTAECWYLDQG